MFFFKENPTLLCVFPKYIKNSLKKISKINYTIKSNRMNSLNINYKFKITSIYKKKKKLLVNKS